jgi:hypothetical protein
MADSAANQALDVVQREIEDGQTQAAWNNADSTEKIADVFNAQQDAQNLNAAQYSGQTDTAPARPESPGGVDPGLFDPPVAEDASADNGGGNA